ncbi:MULTISPECIES: LysR substrate-binding domain-containing protein [Providencia]|jgi:DNA-binding transcriptional LysR family regulator|uniref:LysR substrate-binding domain-containing protein n=1 Tax=Providencia TaxID=586 RepID=UPI001C5B73A5|nr:MULTISPECIES: LysR substrate-binding domain-containing protein [Providencia]ELR5151401.1 LysR family transcriptional regulator [Providencia rettgeri]MDR2227265.1 LysR family transcriptional regulator [Providencia sp.]QXX82686.1 LysR family transcriptional regulator [Providencia sp. R33]
MNPLLNLVLLNTFVAVAETGNFTVASQHLNSTQSTLSQQIQRLETLVGQPLFVRGHRILTLTETGEILLSYAKKILALNDTFFMKITGSAVIHTLRLGFPEDLASGQVTPTLAAFMQANPNVRLEVTSGLSRQLHQRYQHGELDLIIVKQKKGEFKSDYCWPEPLCWLTSNQRQLLNSDSVPLIVFPENGLYRNDMFKLLDNEQRPWHITYTCSSLAGIQSAITDGLGISLLPLRAKLPQHRILTEDDGFPAAQEMEIAMHFHSNASDTLAELAKKLAQQLEQR